MRSYVVDAVPVIEILIARLTVKVLSHFVIVKILLARKMHQNSCHIRDRPNVLAHSYADSRHVGCQSSGRKWGPITVGLWLRGAGPGTAGNSRQQVPILILLSPKKTRTL